MINAKKIFNGSIKESRQHTVLYDHLVSHMKVPIPFDDLLRGQIVSAVAAFDKLMHDLIRIGMCEIFAGKRIATPKYHNEQISIKLHGDLISATLPPKEIIFEAAVVKKLSIVSFQHPDKISDGLSFIWVEPHKWDKIGSKMGMSGAFVSTKMKLVAGRRNAIVHESDMDPLTNAKTPITRAECGDITDFVCDCGNAISDLVI